MTTSRSLQLRLEPGSDDGRIAGRLYDERGQRHDFSGWLGLLTLLEEARVRANSLIVEDRRCDAAEHTDHNPLEER
jgi:hypothetical protein